MIFERPVFPLALTAVTDPRRYKPLCVTGVLRGSLLPTVVCRPPTCTVSHRPCGCLKGGFCRHRLTCGPVRSEPQASSQCSTIFCPISGPRARMFTPAPTLRSTRMLHSRHVAVRCDSGTMPPTHNPVRQVTSHAWALTTTGISRYVSPTAPPVRPLDKPLPHMQQTARTEPPARACFVYLNKDLVYRTCCTGASF